MWLCSYSEPAGADASCIFSSAPSHHKDSVLSCLPGVAAVSVAAHGLEAVLARRQRKISAPDAAALPIHAWRNLWHPVAELTGAAAQLPHVTQHGFLGKLKAHLRAPTRRPHARQRGNTLEPTKAVRSSLAIMSYHATTTHTLGRVCISRSYAAIMSLARSSPTACSRSA